MVDITQGVPSCFYKENFQAGYELIGEPVQTKLGVQLNLKRLTYKSIYGDDVQNIALEIEFQTKDRLRFKVFP